MRRRLDPPLKYNPPGDYGDTTFRYIPTGDMPLPQNVHASCAYAKPPLESIWAEIGSLGLIKDFQGEDLRVGIYLYPPKTGMFDPRPAKWIVFPYRRS
jgi:hypothetical protein